MLIRNIALFGGMIAAGLICARAAPAMMSMRGERGPTILAAANSLGAAVALAVVLIVATILACIIGRIVNACIALFVLGAGVFALDRRLAGIEALAFQDAVRGGGSTLILLAIETLALAAIALGLVLVIFRITGGFPDIEPDEHGERPHWLRSNPAMKMAAAGALMLPAVWLIAQTPMKGQTLAAAIVGAMLSGLVGRLVAPHVQPVLAYVAPMVFGAVGLIIARLTMNAPLEDAHIAGTLSVFARMMPLDYLAGTFLGTSFGLGWAKSFLHHEDVPQAVTGINVG